MRQRKYTIRTRISFYKWEAGSRGGAAAGPGEGGIRRGNRGPGEGRDWAGQPALSRHLRAAKSRRNPGGGAARAAGPGEGGSGGATGKTGKITAKKQRQGGEGGVKKPSECAALDRQSSATETRQRRGKLPCNFPPLHTVQQHPPVPRHHTSQSPPLTSLYNTVTVKCRFHVPRFCNLQATPGK